MSPTHQAADMLSSAGMHLIRCHTPFTYQKRFAPPDMIQNCITDQRLTSDNTQWWRLKQTTVSATVFLQGALD